MKKYYLGLLFIILLGSCATKKEKYVSNDSAIDVATNKELSHTFYLIGDAGLSPENKLNPTLKLFKERLEKAEDNSTVLFLGDNIYPAGLPDKDKDVKGHKIAKNHLDAQLKTLSNYKGNTIFIPGNHDWYNDGLKGLEREEKYIQDALKSKEVFFPENGCPIEKIEINEKVVVIAIDSQWYLANWDKHPTMNDDCEIKDREKFFQELEGLIKKNEDKTTIIAIHHPMFSYGVHGGQTSFKKNIYPGHTRIPLPILGSFINVLRRTTGASMQDMNNRKYRELRKRIVTLAQYSNKVIFASGHEHTLQYIVEENIPQIVSGSGAKEEASKLLNGAKFSTGKNGYAVLEVYKDGSSRVRYYGISEKNTEKFLYTSEVLPSQRKENKRAYNTSFPPLVEASIYSKEEVEKSKFYTWFWGERYRDIYGQKVAAPTVNLDTLFGGLKVMRKGGGHQSKSLRLVNSKGQEYVMRALRKSAEVYLQAAAFKDQYIIGDFEDTYVQKTLLDFYTGSHPYAPFTIGTLSDAVGIYHTNPVLYYIPKQPAIKEYTDEFGDALYMIEERTDDNHGDKKSFGFANKMKSTDDLLKKLRKDEDFKIDKQAYVKVRLFDMLIGDWDRHTDQWRWAEFKDKETGETIYKPVPRDRDQAFSIMGDGAFMSFATRAIPSLSLMEGFNNEIRNVKGFNGSPMTFALDMTLLPETTLDLWLQQARYLQENITEEVIDQAFLNFPKEVRGEKTEELKSILLSRKQHLIETAKAYFNLLNKFSTITGTDKDDYFTITGQGSNSIKVEGHRIKKGKKTDQFFSKVYSKSTSKEIWIYGLDDDDYFDVKNITKSMPKLRIVGGQNNDIYDVVNSKGVYLYDNKLKKNTLKSIKGAKVRFTTDYETNTYQPIKYKTSNNQLIPMAGYNPDDGFRLGISNTYVYNGLRQNPFTRRHILNAQFYFATSGFDILYKGEFANIFGNANLEVLAKLTSPNFSVNFFGYGNDSENLDNDLDLDFNRVKLETFKAAPSLVWRGELGSKFRTGVTYESIEVEETENRFINTFLTSTNIDNSKSFVGVDGEYTYSNIDNNAFPTMGMATSLHAGYTTSVDGKAESYGFVIPSISFNYKLVPSGSLVFATKWKAHFNIGNGYEFYQAASIGGLDGLRGFRNQRFTGKTAYYQNTDIRYNLRTMKTGIIPITIGVYGGYDYGRVWFPGLSSNQWHTSAGGGFFLNASDVASARFALFNSEDGVRFSFGIGFGF
ncbi:calcineurin-like phosphoesterase family protein [Maribacter vaceletii]|uniref:Calcineurin-like phosphoesterase family protein n=1 Tax=Maribacter vaceletii TaxID=1206816 RepID=A0A495EEP9_9FLAO|nr:metallophosphoesterase [Maribacter vaceletii]RKR15139.1 calcineurin-like phosphoesterase family protein [Maribacter vaceletii]